MIYIILFIIVILLFTIRYIIAVIGDNIIFQPTKECITIRNKCFNFDVKDGFIMTSDNEKLHYIFINNPNSKYVFIYAHGNSGNITYQTSDENNEIVKFILQYGSILMFDYRAYGKSSGIPSEKGLQNDILAVWNYALKIENNKYNADHIILYGFSLGCSFVAWLGAYLTKDNKTLPKMIIMQSGFYDIVTIASHKLGSFVNTLAIFSPYELNNYKYIKTIKKYNKNYNVIIMHSKNDDHIPYSDSDRLAKDTNSTFIEIFGTHNNPLFDKVSLNNLI